MMRNRILSPSTYNQRLCAIHAFFDYVMTEEPAIMPWSAAASDSLTILILF